MPPSGDWLGLSVNGAETLNSPNAGTGGKVGLLVVVLPAVLAVGPLVGLAVDGIPKLKPGGNTETGLVGANEVGIADVSVAPAVSSVGDPVNVESVTGLVESGANVIGDGVPDSSGTSVSTGAGVIGGNEI